MNMAIDIDAPGDEQLQIVRGLRGVVHAFYLDADILNQVKEEAAKVRAMGNIDVDNEGFNQALNRECVICIVKDPRFRPPPEPTVILLSGNGEVIGEEVFPFTAQKYADKQDVVWLSDGFILFPTVKADGGETFIMPPVSFPELNPSNGCRDVISCSPAPTCDLMIRKYYGMEDNPKLASVLVAFNRLKPGESAPDLDESIATIKAKEAAVLGKIN